MLCVASCHHHPLLLPPQATVEEGDDFCVVHPPQRLNPDVEIDTYDDHRMAMCFALAACGGVSVVIRDPACTSKTFPTFFEELEKLARTGREQG